MFGIVAPFEGIAGPGGGLDDEGLHLGMGQYLCTGGPHLGVVLGPVQQVHQCAVARPGHAFG